MELKITPESLEAAKRAAKQPWQTVERTIIAALDALCVPVEEGWVEGNNPPHKEWRRYFDKGSYRLICWEENWMLYLWSREADKNIRHLRTKDVIPFHLDVAQAQAWADEQIAKAEAEPQKIASCDYCGMDLPAQCVPWKGYRFCDNRCCSLYVKNLPKPKPAPGWVETDKTKYWTDYNKEEYLLVYFHHSKVWRLYVNTTHTSKSINEISINFAPEPKYAKKWADEQIAKYEAGQISKPAPGPGTKLVLPDGNKVVICKFDDHSDYPFFALNKNTNYLLANTINGPWYSTPESLITALGATIKED